MLSRQRRAGPMCEGGKKTRACVVWAQHDDCSKTDTTTTLAVRVALRNAAWSGREVRPRTQPVIAKALPDSRNTCLRHDKPTAGTCVCVCVCARFVQHTAREEYTSEALRSMHKTPVGRVIRARAQRAAGHRRGLVARSGFRMRAAETRSRPGLATRHTGPLLVKPSTLPLPRDGLPILPLF